MNNTEKPKIHCTILIKNFTITFYVLEIAFYANALLMVWIHDTTVRVLTTITVLSISKEC